MTSRRKLMLKYLEIEIDAMRNLDIEKIQSLITLVEEVRKKKSKIYICGNGGSASTASHLACDMNKCINQYLDEKINAVCLNDNVAIMTAIANDHCYEDVFYQQLTDKLEKEDMLIIISGSGNSPNVVKAAELGKERQSNVVSLTGFDGGRLKSIADLDINIPIHNMQIAEDCHLIICHLFTWIMMEEG